MHTYGCQMNERDSDMVSALLLGAGHTRAEGEADADLVIVNTCSVRGKAEEKAIGKMNLLIAGRRREGRDRPRVGAVGCMVERLLGDLFEKVPGLDFAVGPRDLHQVVEVVSQLGGGQEGRLSAGGSGGLPAEVMGRHASAGISAFVNILLGCNRRCAYCIVPLVRGREWSRPVDEVLEEVRGLVARGVSEVTLLGQSVMSYGRANDVWEGGAASAGGYVEPLPRLLEALSGVAGLSRLRFTSGHPSGCTAELARAMGELKPVCEHLHLPLQSGSDRILSAMRRGYTVEDYRAAVGRLRGRVPDLALTTDIIVGFPGETELDFEATRAFMDEMRFDNAFVFKYSPRPGTPAADLVDDVAEEEKLRRNHVLLEDQERRGQALNELQVGRVVRVLAEGPSLRDRARWSGRTRGNKIVIFEASPGLAAGVEVRVRVVRARPQTLYGEVVDERGQAGGVTG